MITSIDRIKELFALRRYPEVIEHCEQFLINEYESIEVIQYLVRSLIVSNRLEEVKKYINKALIIEPSNYEFLKEYGNYYQLIGDIKQAKVYYQKAIDVNPSYAPALTNLGGIELKYGKKEDALLFLVQATEADPSLLPGWVNLATGYIDLREYEKAKDAYQQVIKLSPNLFKAHYQLGCIYQEQKKFEEAEKFLRRSIELKPDVVEAHLNLGIVLKEQGKLEEAEAPILEAIKLKPQLSKIHFILASLYIEQKKFEEAEKSLRRSIELKPDFVEAFVNLGSLFFDQKKYDNCDQFFLKAIELDNNLLIAYVNLGKSLCIKGQLEEAELYLRKVIDIDSQFGEGYLELSNILFAQGRLNEAEKMSRKAINLNSKSSDAWNNLGLVLLERMRRENTVINECEDCFFKSIEIAPLEIEAYVNLGLFYLELKNYDKAEDMYRKGCEIDPFNTQIISSLVRLLSNTNKWEDLDREYKKLKKCDNGWLTINPLLCLYFEDDPELESQRCKEFFKLKYYRPKSEIILKRKEKIRIGYFSNNFCGHSTILGLIRVIELHDKSQFEIFIYDFGNHRIDEYTRRIQDSVDQYRLVKDLTDIELVRLAREDQLDIGIDLMGYTLFNRASIFSERIAPIQITYGDCDYTTGNHSMDYIIADQTLIPHEDEKYYVEKVIRMPHARQPFDDTLVQSIKSCSRSDLGIREDAFVFCFFGNNAKIQLREFTIWMNLLLKRENSVLWLIEANEISKQNIHAEAAKRGVSPDRIIFSKTIGLSDHISRQSCADLQLDTFNFSSGTMTALSLIPGLPILTFPGRTFTSRLTASILNSLGLHELVATSEKDYEQKALELSENKSNLDMIKKKINSLKSTAPYFNSQKYCYDFERKLKDLISNHYDRQ